MSKVRKNVLETEISDGSSVLKNDHFYYNSAGLMVFTEKYHLERGYCCKNGCLHCPFPNFVKKLTNF